MDPMATTRDTLAEGEERRLPPRQVLTRKWPVLTYGDTPRIDLKDWRFRLFGKVGREKILTWEEFNALPRMEAISDMHCVTRWSRTGNRWEGVPAREVVRLAEPLPSARFVMVHAYGDYTTNLPLAALLEEGVMFATHHDGEALEAEHGGPMRLVVPSLYLWKSAKWANGLEFMDTDTPGFWERNGYHMRGDPWKEERHSGW
jgi:DMSO/TMAO reductase YedYZ molybdopterin-dependent catalytic subunit